MNFSFHDDNHKVKEMTEVVSRDHKASIIESDHPPRFMSRKISKRYMVHLWYNCKLERYKSGWIHTNAFVYNHVKSA